MWTDKIVKVFEEDDPLAEETEEQRRGKSVAEGEEEWWALDKIPYEYNVFIWILILLLSISQKI